MINVTPKHTKDQLRAYTLQQVLRHLAPNTEELIFAGVFLPPTLPQPATPGGRELTKAMQDMDIKDQD